VKSYLVAPEAEDDLRQIWRYLLGEAGLDVANRIQTELVDAFEALADFPGRGHRRPDLANAMFFFLASIST
jgi:plasmid stabilization system protein ParE